MLAWGGRGFPGRNGHTFTWDIISRDSWLLLKILVDPNSLCSLGVRPPGRSLEGVGVGGPEVISWSELPTQREDPNHP